MLVIELDDMSSEGTWVDSDWKLLMWLSELWLYCGLLYIFGEHDGENIY
jgi:hypothetical protein